MIIEHSSKRLKERMGVKSESKQENIVRNAYMRGKPITNYTGKDRKYLERLSQTSAAVLNNRDLRVYQDKIFIFDGDLCVTILQLPKKFGKKMYHGEKRQKEDCREAWDEFCAYGMSCA